MTKQLKKWLVENMGVNVNADDKTFDKAASEALLGGKLSREKYLELTKDEDDDDADRLIKRIDRLDRLADGIEGVLKVLTKDGKDVEEKAAKEKAEKEAAEKAAKEKAEKAAKEKAEKEKTKPPTRLAKMFAGAFSDEYDSEKTVEVRVKEAVEQYDDSHKTLTYPVSTKGGRPHPMAGQPVREHGRSLNEASDRDKALAGVWAKYQILAVTPRFAGNPTFAWERLNDHEKSLLASLAENGEWDDSEDSRSRIRKGYPGGIKALIDDSTSGGLEAAPIVYDDQVIETPLLYGELYPLVNTVPLARGRRIEGVSTGTVTGGWGGVDATAITLFNTASYVSAFDTTIYRWQGAIQIGLDFMSDTPIDFGAHITRQYGERLLEDLDDVVAVGNGTTQPEGIINKSGTTSVAFGGTTTVGNYESLRFGVHKREHRANVRATAVFCGTDTSYQRVKALNVGSADARRLYAMGSMAAGTYDDYRLMERPYKINESLSNSQIFYAILAGYRMYRRKGLAIRTSTEGDTLIRNNEMLIVAMARYGGQLERGALAAITTTAPA